MPFTESVHTIHYAEARFVTGDDVAAAVVEYAAALARQGTAADTVTIPVRDADGSTVQVDLLIGPASQIIAEPTRDAGPELADPAAVARIDAQAIRSRMAQVATSVTADRQDGTSVPGLEDLEA